MELEDHRDLVEAFGMFWAGKIPEGDAFVRERLKRHPAFVAMLAEEAVILATLTEEPAEYVKAAQILATAEKRINELYKQHRPALKAFLQATGKANKGSSTTSGHGSASSTSSSSSAGVESPESIETLKNELRQRGQAVEEESSSDEVVSEADLGLGDDDSSSRISSSDPKFQVSSALFCKVLLAEVCLWNSMNLFKQRKFVKGVLDFRRSWKTYSDAADIIKTLTPPGQEYNDELPLFKEIKCSVDFGMGVFHFGVSSVPPAYRWIVEGVGFKGDRAASLIELKSSSEIRSGHRSALSALMFAFIKAMFYNEYEVAYQVLHAERDRFPTASIVHYTLGYVYRKEGNIDLSQDSFRAAQQHAHAIREFQMKLNYEIGYNHYLINDWSAALPLLEGYVTETKSEAFRAYGAFQVGFCYLMQGDVAKATTFMKKVSGWYRKNYTFDEFANRHSKKFLKKKFTDFELHFHCALLLVESGRFDQCLTLLQGTIQPFIKTFDDKSCWHSLAGTCLFNLKRHDDAKVQFNHALKNEKKIQSETFCIPFSYYGLAEISLHEGNLDEADTHAKKADSFSGYDFDSFLSWKIKKVQEEIAAKRA